MKRMTAIFCACALLCGCQQSTPELVPETTTVQAATETTAEATTAAQQETTASAPKLLSLAADWSNRFELMRSHGVSMNLKNSDGEFITDTNCRAESGKLNVQLVYAPNTDPAVEPADARIAVFAAINGQLCDFTAGNVQSEQGCLLLVRPVNSESTDTLILEDVPMQKGGNKLTVCLLVWFPQMGLCSAAEYEVPFASDAAFGGKTAEQTQTSALKGVETVSSAGKTAAEIQNLKQITLSVTESDVPTDPVNGAAYISAETPLRFPLANDSPEESKKKTGFCVIMQDGAVIPGWNGKQLLSLSMKETDIVMNLPFSASCDSGRYTAFACAFFELNAAEQPQCISFSSLCFAGEKP